jgi:O-antigen/teichoic acid export membrane protein
LADQAVRPASLARFSAWIMASDVAFYGFAIVPRVALIHLSYRQVAYFDVALLIYQIPQRIAASVVIALIPVAARLQVDRRRVPLPGLLDAATLAAAVAALDAVLWSTHLIRRGLEAAGLEQYAAAEPLLLIVILAAPAELLFTINKGVLQALGDSRSPARVAWGVLLASLPLVPFAVLLGAAWVAALLVGELWVLYLVSRCRIPREETREVHVVGRVFALARSRHATV